MRKVRAIRSGIIDPCCSGIDDRHDRGDHRLCACGERFTPKRSSQVRCRPNCRPRDHGTRKQRDLPEFIGVDGEGVTREDGSHDYILLTVGDQHLHRDGARLGFIEIMEFLYAQRCDAAFVGFYLGYDFAQWFRDLPAERARRLLSARGIASRRRRIPHLPPFPVEWEGWEFDILPMRRFRLRPCNPAKAPWLTICDVGAFFQCSFLKAIDPAKSSDPIVTAAEYALIAKGKDGRSVHQFNAAMLRYNALECDVLARLMTQQRDGLIAEGIKLRRNQWIGPGQASQHWLRNIEAPTAEAVRTVAPEPFRDAAKASYFGGWFEIFWHGLNPGTSWSYDINSAYPDIMARLPCLLHGTWHEGPDAAGRPLELVYGTVRGRNATVGAMLHRTTKRGVLRPRTTQGWYWRHELDAARACGVIADLDIEHHLGYTPCACAPPLAPIAELYLGRIKVGKNTPAGRAKRLVYNATYGKFAQSVGSPVFGNAIYASLITSQCRSMILRAIATHPHGIRDLLMVATDSVTFRTRHPGLEIDAARLGAWTESRHENMSLMMPGIYWDDETRRRLAEGADPALKSRGIRASDLAARIGQIDRAWQRFDRDGYPRLLLPVSFQLVSPRQALARNKWELCGTVVINGRRIISADPSLKRVGFGPGRSRAYSRAPALASTPYDGSFGDVDDEMVDEFGDHPDLPPDRLLPEVLYG